MQKVIFTVLILLFSASVHAQTGYYQKDSLAIRGYDPVAYFTESRAVKGEPELSYRWQGTTWLFSNEGHRQAFIKTPEAYAPEFGGYCAYGASEKHLSPTDPQAWTIINGRLYLNYSQKVKSLWLPDTTVRISSAKQYWSSLKQ